MEGFEKTGLYETIGAVEWEKKPCENFANRLENKWGYADARERVLYFDIQRTNELFEGWKDENYGASKGLDYLVKKNGPVDVIIGGPPCQAYSIAGRVRDEHGMRYDYRNYLFESYLKVVNHYRPHILVFENVPGMLSAKPTGEPIVDLIGQSFDEIGYTILPDLKDALIDFTEYGVPQNRSRVIIVGIDRDHYGTHKSQKMVRDFYEVILPRYKVKRKQTVFDAIGDLPKLMPLGKDIRYQGRKTCHSLPYPRVENHVSRWHNSRDRKIFHLLAEDIQSGTHKYTSTDALKKLYAEVTGKKSNVHKYYVLRWDEQSNLIPAHLYKDGLRHIHPDPEQERTITVREAARLQTFPDDYVFLGSNTDTYKMIGNAVPPLFSEKLALAIYDMINNNNQRGFFDEHPLQSS